jgi:adenylate kinase family enzyme
MQRVIVIGNSGGGKSLLARQIAERFRLPYFEINTILWQQGWRLGPHATYAAEHARLIAGDLWSSTVWAVGIQFPHVWSVQPRSWL